MTDQPDWNDLLDLIARFDEGEYENVSVQFGDVSLRMSRSGGLIEAERAHNPIDAASNSRKVEPKHLPVAELAGPAVKSPMIGVFYRQSSPGSPPFVEPGQTVTADTTVGIIELMKLMNPVKAGADGIIGEFVVKDGEAVEFGQILAVFDTGTL